ncbi:MAG: GNAT family N-acetyltransferase [Anaerolineae bacterium]
MTEITYTTINHDLCQPVADLVDICFPDMPDIDKYDREDLEIMADRFSEGTIVALSGETVVGMGTGIFTDIDFDNMPPTENDLLSVDGKFAHNPDGDYYYGSDFCVHPEYRGRGIGRGIYDRRKAVAIRHNKVGFAAAAVLPGYADHKLTIDIHAYLAKVIAGEVFDPTLSMQMRNGFKVVRPIKDFFTYPKSDNWAALILWENESHR